VAAREHRPDPSSDETTTWRVLIVDDVRDNREMYVEYLAFCGLEVDSAASAEEALQKIDRAPPHVVVMDLGLPKMDGVEATRRIKREPRFAATSVIVLSGFADAAHEAKARKAGADWFATKPCTPFELLQLIMAALPIPEDAPLARPTTRTRRKR
jgi:CheY-like chemotaxis protein